MESDRNSKNRNGSSARRSGARSARPSLAELLESVTISDEHSATDNNFELKPDDTLTDNNFELKSGDMLTTLSSKALVPPDLGPLRSTSGRPKNDIDPLDDIPTKGRSASAIAAQKRRQSLYSRRSEGVSAERDTESGRSESGRSETKMRGFGSLADRIFGESRSATDEPATSGRSSSSSFSGTSSLDPSLSESSSAQMTDSAADDWTAKFSADAPLPSSSDSSPRDSYADTSENASALIDKRALGAQRRASTYGATLNHTPSQIDSSPKRNPLLRNQLARPPRKPMSSSQPMPPSQSTSSSQSMPTQRPMPRRYSTAPASPDESLNSVSIKGRSDGVSIELGQGLWVDIMETLSQRLVQSTGFFRGGEVTVNVGGRPLRQNELLEICELTEAHGLMITSIRSRSEQSCQLALAAGLAASLDAPDGLLAQPAASNYEKLEHFVYRGNLRSGQILRRAETILVMGDVNPGSRIVSDSDILVWGRLRGIAHAGAAGDTNAVIAALLMEPTQIRISNSVAILPEHELKTSFTEKFAGNTSPNGIRRPEIAHSIGEDIIVDMWDESKPGGIMAFRRMLPN